MTGDVADRNGWCVACSSTVHDQGASPLVCISRDDVRFYLPQDLYDDLVDEAFLALCEAQTGMR